MSNMPQVLIVDDEPSARQTIEMLLLRENFALHFAANGPQALDMLQSISPDVILLDVMMPGMDGFEVCQQLKNNVEWEHIPIILVTALDTKQDLARGLDSGADDFLHKPFNGLELRARVRSMLRIKHRHDELDAALRLREDLSNMIVHDIRGPLSSIMMYCDLAEAQLPVDFEPNHIATIRNEMERLNSFLTDMLMMAKMEDGRFRLTYSAEDIFQLVRESIENYQPIAQFKKIKFNLNLPPEPFMVSVDANLWRRVFDNLLSNALKFSPSGGTITLQAGVKQDQESEYLEANPTICISIIDEGPGIPPEHSETIFDKFKIIGSGRRDIAQVGLGLAFCKMVVMAHKGKIFVKPNQPKGSIFTVEI